MKRGPERGTGGAVPTISREGKRLWLYPLRRTGVYTRLRRKIAVVLMAIYIIVPWLSVDGIPLLRFDVGARIIYFFCQVFRLNDFASVIYLVLLFGLVLFLSTTVKGRLWCGFACPQTVFLDWLIRPIEEWLEGNAHHRKNSDQKGLTLKLAARKAVKHALFFAIALALANVLLGYFVPLSVLRIWITSSPLDQPLAFAIVASITLALYFDFSWFREQFCTFLCPYARFQSVLTDDFTKVVSYDYNRGEPRGQRAKGDCIDCQMCVRVCPTGIDIRNGLQMECIQCLRCVDACAEIMTSLKRPLGLIRLESNAELKKSQLSAQVFAEKKLSFRIRIVLYGVLLAIVLGLCAWKFGFRSTLTFTFIRQSRGSVISHFDDGRLGNIFSLRVVNNSNATYPLAFTVLSTPGVEMLCGACAQSIAPYEEKTLAVVFAIDPSFAQSHVGLVHASTGQEFSVPLILPSRSPDKADPGVH